MTKMHFTRAAEMVKGIVDGEWTNALPGWASDGSKAPSAFGLIETSTSEDGNIDSNYIRAVWTAEAFIILFREYNPRFNEQKFLKACGLSNG